VALEALRGRQEHIQEIRAKHQVHPNQVSTWKRLAVDGRHRVRRLMGMMGREAIYKRLRTSQPHPAHRVYPSYLLKDIVIGRPGQVWCANITTIPVRREFLYLVAIMDWDKVLA